MGASLMELQWAAIQQLGAAKELKKLEREDILIVVGGVIPPQDFEALVQAGAAAIYPPGTVITEAAVDLLEKLGQALGIG